MTTNRKDLVIVELSNGFCVRDLSVPHTELHNRGFLCEGCPTREDAEQFITKYIAEERERTKRMKERADEPWPFDADDNERESKP
jgi:hypothetical protein